MKKIDKIIYSDKTPDKNSIWARKTNSGEWECLMFSGSTWIASTNQNILDSLSDLEESIEAQKEEWTNTLINKEELLADIISILTARINALEDLLSGNLGDIEVNNLTINQGLNIHGSEGNNVLTGATEPADIPDHIFQVYVAANGDLYISKNNTAVSDWVKIN